VRCSADPVGSSIFEGCPACRRDGFRANYEVAEDQYRSFSPPGNNDRRGGIWRWRDSLPPLARGHEVTLGEGNTPLLVIDRAGRKVYLKDESQNPTWSHKDRLCAVAASHAASTGAKVTVVSSSGNHALSAAAYAARAGLPCVVITHEGMPAPVRSAVTAYGAHLVIVPGDRRWDLVERSVHELGWYPFSNFTAPATGNPVAVEGYKTIAFELAEQLGWKAPTSVIVPTGYAEALCGIWRGFKEMHTAGTIGTLPRMISVEPAVSAPLHNSLAQQLTDPAPVQGGKSLASSINVKVTSLHALMSIQESQGHALAVSETDILTAHHELARHGFYVENASATSFAGLAQAEASGLDLGEHPVLISTSSGIKDATSRQNTPPATLDGSWQSFLNTIPDQLLLLSA
jgi:threonine synthase